MKTLLSVFLAFFLLLSLTACGETTKPTGTSTEEPTEQNQSDETDTTTDNVESNAPVAETPIDITLGSPYTMEDLCEFTVNFAQLKKEVLPPNPDDYYTYYPEEDGKTFVDISISVKNLRTTSRTSSDFGKVVVLCDGKYEYSAFSTIESSNGGDFTYTNITSIDPLTSGTIHYIASIPNEVADDTSVPISAKIKMLDKEYTLSIR